MTFVWLLSLYQEPFFSPFTLIAIRLNKKKNISAANLRWYCNCWYQLSWVPRWSTVFFHCLIMPCYISGRKINSRRISFFLHAFSHWLSVLICTYLYALYKIPGILMFPLGFDLEVQLIFVFPDCLVDSVFTTILFIKHT